jgi:hypothetical protein
MIASGGTLALVGAGLAVGGAFMGGVTLGTIITGETITGKKLTDDQRAEMGGELLGGVIGGGAAGKAFAEPAAPDTEIVNDIIGKPRVDSALKNDVPKPTELPLKNYGRPAVREFGPKPKGHGFPDMIDNYAGDATTFDLGKGAKLYQIEGSHNGTEGRFEWITEGGNVTHRQFVPGGRITGKPIKP